MSKTAYLFPGQGSQVVGMGHDFYTQYPEARTVFEQANAILGFPLSTVMFEGPAAELDDTITTQPALYVCSVAILRVLEARQPEPDMLAGHSLGEFTALHAAGSLTFEDGLRLVRERGRLMKEAGEAHSGAMAALLGMDADAVRLVCAEIEGVVVLANDNCPGQTVISGDVDAIEAAMALAGERGARKAVRLAVSVAAHSPLMQPAAAEFRQALEAVDFQPPRIPVVGNVNAAPLTTVEAIREELNGQLTGAVRWTESMQAMIAAGVTDFVEVGSGDVLTGLMKRIDRSATRRAINTVDAV